MANRKSPKSPSRPLSGAASSFALFLDCQAVVALRLARLAGGGAVAAREASRMVQEKFEAALEAQLAAGAAIAAGKPALAFGRAATAYRRRVSANRRRLS